MKSPKISVIVPIYKVEKYLCQCIDSILAQTLKEIEVILVDEGDLDACRAICDMYEFGPKKDERIRSIHKKNGGYGASVNKGFSIAKGEYVSIIESDDFIDPKMYEEMYSYAKKLDADIVKVPYYEYWDKTDEMEEKIQLCFWRSRVKNVPQNHVFRIEDYPQLCATHPSIWAALYKRNYLEEKKIKCVEAKGAGYVDNLFRLQTLCQTKKIAWLDKPFNYYRLSNPNASQANYNLAAFVQRWKEVHEFFKTRPTQWNILAPYCLCEENENIFSQLYLNHYAIDEKSFQLIQENLSCWTEENIKKAHFISKRNIKEILWYKKNPGRIKKYIQKPKTLDIFWLFGIIPFTIECARRNVIYIHLLKKIKFAKIKQKTIRRKNVYFLGFIPIACYETKQKEST